MKNIECRFFKFNCDVINIVLVSNNVNNILINLFCIKKSPSNDSQHFLTILYDSWFNKTMNVGTQCFRCYKIYLNYVYIWYKHNLCKQDWKWILK